MYLSESPQPGDSNKYAICMIHENTVQKCLYSCFRRVHIKFLYNSKFDLTAKSLVTNSVVITRVLCNYVTRPNLLSFYGSSALTVISHNFLHGLHVLYGAFIPTEYFCSRSQLV